MTRRLVLSYLAITLVVLLLLEIPLAVFYSQREEERFIADVERDAVVLASFYEDALQGGGSPDPLPASDYSTRTTARIVVVDVQGISVLDTDTDQRRDFSTRPEFETALTGRRSSGIRRSETLDTDLLYVAVPVASGGTVHGALRVTIDPHEVTERIQRFWLGLLGIAAIVLMAAIGLGWAIARSVTKPLRQLQVAARRFADGDLRTLEVDGEAPREVTELSDTMNLMAKRLDELITKQRSFVGDASHQLRTPLTALRLRLENLEAGLGDEPSIAEANAAIVEIERLSTLVDDLLQLARAEKEVRRQSINAARVAADRIDTWAAVADEAHVTLSREFSVDEANVLAGPGVVDQLLDNAIDNALAVSPPGSAIDVGLIPGSATTTITVSDHGPGLSDAEKVQALQRFWRGDPSTPGSGLGLSIAKTLVEANGGQLRLTDSPSGGLTVTYELDTAPGST